MPTTFQHRERVSAGRRVARALALLLAGLQFLGLAHLGLERHGVCWEHGTLTELGASNGLAPDVMRADLPAGLRTRRASPTLEDEGHHHCPVQASRRDWGGPPAGALLALPLDVASTDMAFGASVLRADAGLLGRAPKQSPPRTA
jgi:hypothetical protein